MSPISFLRANIARVLGDRSGNFAMMTAILMPVAIGAAGLAVDISNVALSRQQLQEASDAAALATASALADGKIDTAAASAFAKDFLAGQMANYVGDTAALRNATTTTATKTTSGSATSYSVKVSSAYSMQLSGLAQVVGFKTTDIDAASQTTSGTDETKTALSMELVLDQSGSMGYNTSTCAVYKTDQTTCKKYVIKIDALKSAAAALFDALDKADPEHVLVRTGVMSYNNGLLRNWQNKVISISPLSWGTDVGRAYVKTLTAVDGTDATEPMQESTKALTTSVNGTDESTEHAKKGNTKVDRYIVLMTDGEMTGNSSSWNSTKDQNVRNACNDAKKAGVTIFTVAFMAPDKGKSLLQYCASSTSDYFEAETMEKLISAFDSIAQTATKALTRLTN
ncbi:Flp pilus assembly protein TadG [Rhizobium azibense]|nr:Flp pilus assembly protein TadG [Rhizobium azibense]